MKKIVYIVWSILLVSCVSIENQPTNYSTLVPFEGRQVKVKCSGKQLIGSDCVLQFLGDHAHLKSLQLAFNANFTYQTGLLQRLIQNKNEWTGKLSDAEHIELQDLELVKQCKAESTMGQSFIACSPSGVTNKGIQILFLRGTCDSCRFSPMVLRKVNQP